MNIEEIRTFALSLHPEVTEDLFIETVLSIRIHGKWFVLIRLETDEPNIAVNMQPDVARELRERYDAIRPAYHMNKEHCSDLFVERLDDGLIKQLIRQSYTNIVQKLPKKYHDSLALNP